MSDFLAVNKLKRNFLDGDGNQLEVLKGIDFNIKKGETVAIVGQSGAGKSVFLQILGGLDQPSSGNYHLAGEDIYSNDDNRLADWRCRKIGFVFQHHQLLADFTALENVMLPALIKGLTKNEALERAKRQMDRLKLGHRLNHKVLRLSGGEQQRVAIARSLINDPLLLLADEPTGSLDHKTGLDVLTQLLQNAADNETTLIVVTHNKEISTKLNKTWLLREGRLKQKN